MVTCVPLSRVRQSRKAAWRRGGAGWQGSSLFERLTYTQTSPTGGIVLTSTSESRGPRSCHPPPIRRLLIPKAPSDQTLVPLVRATGNRRVQGQSAISSREPAGGWSGLHTLTQEPRKRASSWGYPVWGRGGSLVQRKPRVEGIPQPLRVCPWFQPRVPSCWIGRLSSARSNWEPPNHRPVTTSFLPRPSHCLCP